MATSWWSTDVARVQIEFLFRDSHQFTGLSDCQARAEAALVFPFNAALVPLNLARAEEGLASPTNHPGSSRWRAGNNVISMNDCLMYLFAAGEYSEARFVSAPGGVGWRYSAACYGVVH